jgi:PEGA domain/Tetratricopeptide repeat
MTMRHGCVLFVAAATFVPTIAFAEGAPTQAVKTEARSRFDRGLSLFEDGDNTGALAEFKRAYELIPNPVVLFNIGLVYAAMNRPAEAAEALQKLLKEPGSLSPDHIAKAKQTLAEQEARVAEITVTSSVPASIEIDNVQMAKTPLAAPLRIAGGAHIVGAVAPGYTPQRKEVTVAGGSKGSVSFELTAMEGTLAHVTLKSHLPGADVVIDGEVAGHTPLASSLTVTPGPHKIELRRKGYQSAKQDLTLGDGASGEVSLDPEEDKSALIEVGGDLKLVVSEPQALVTVDGKSRGVYATPLRLASGAHRLLIERGGFRSLERDVDVAAGTTTTISVVLEPTPETRQIYVNHANGTRTLSWIGILGGAALAGGGIGYVALNANSRSDAQTELDAKVSQRTNKVGICDIMAGGDFDQCNKQVDDAQSKVNSAKTRDAIGYGAAVVGGIVAAFGVYGLISGDDPGKYDRKPAGSTDIAKSLVPMFAMTPGGGFASVVGRF